MGRRRWEPRRVRLGVARGRAPSGAMASRIGKQRKQKKYSEGGVVFTPAFIARIPSAAAAKGTDDASDDATSDDFHAALAAFWARLRGFAALGSAEAELHGVHDLVGALAALARACDRTPGADDGARVPIADDDDAPPAPATGERELAFVAAARAFFGVMFLPNSRQLHRALITSRKKLGARGARLAETALLAETSAAIDDALAELKGNRDGRPFNGCLSTATAMRPATALASVNMVQPRGLAERRVLRGVAVRAASLIAAGERRRPTGRVFLLLPRVFPTRASPPRARPFDPAFATAFFVSRPRRAKVMKPHYKTGITV